MDDQNRIGEEEVRRLIEEAGPRPPVPQEDLDAIMAAAHSAWREQVRRRTETRARPPVRAWAAAALAAAVLIAVGLLWWQGQRKAQVPLMIARLEAARSSLLLESGADAAPRRLAVGEEIPRGALLRTEGPGGASLRVTGGTTLRLAAGTRLRLATATAFDLEQGAIYLDTGGESRSEAVTVRTPVATAKDIGTQFAVALVGSPEAMHVRVREGAVSVERGGSSYLAPAGQELLLRRDGTLELREIAGHGSEWDWVVNAAPPFEIEGRTLRQLLDWVSRENGWQVRFAEESLAAEAEGIVLHGSLGGLRPDQAPFAVLPGAGLEGELKEGVLTVRRVTSPR